MRRVVNATCDLKIGGEPAEGCPLLICDGMVEPLPSMWLAGLGGAPRYDTARTYAYAFMRWMEWLDLRRIDLWKVTVTDVKRFGLILSSNRSNSTVNVHLAAVCSFYGWAYEEGYTYILPFRLATKVWKKRDALPKVGEVKFRKVQRTKPRAHTVEEFDTILANTQRKSVGLIFRDELVAEFGFRSGLRSMEVAELRVHDLDQAEKLSEYFTIDLDKTKFSRPRTIVISSFHHHRILRYISMYRSKIVRRAVERDVGYRDPGHLFLTDAGKPYQRRYISSAWRAAALQANVPSKFHLNRHSFATRLIAACNDAGLPGRLITRDFLGHVSEQTTDVYDHTPKIPENVAKAEWFSRVLRGDV